MRSTESLPAESRSEDTIITSLNAAAVGSEEKLLGASDERSLRASRTIPCGEQNHSCTNLQQVSSYQRELSR